MATMPFEHMLSGTGNSSIDSCAAIEYVVVSPFSSFDLGVLQMFESNLPIIVLLFSAVFFLQFWKLRSPVITVPMNPNVLVAMVLTSGILIAILASVIGVYGLYDYHEGHSVGFETTPSGYWPDITMTTIAITGGLVFASVYLVSFAIMRMRLITSLIPSMAITIFVMIVSASTDTGMLSEVVDTRLITGLSFLCVPPVMFAIIHLHKTRGYSS